MSGSDPDAAAIRASLETTRHRDPATVAHQMTTWLQSHGGGQVTAITAPTGSGASSELFLADLEDAPLVGEGHRRVVVRMVGEHSVYPIVDPVQQYLCQRLIAERSDAPVPAAYAVEADPAPLGAPFTLMAWADGQGAPDWPSYVTSGWLHDLTDGERTTLWVNAVAAVAAVHATDLEGVDIGRLSLPTPGDRAIDRLVSYWQLYHAQVAAGGSYPALDRAIAWLDAERPRHDHPPRMIWGDASLRNMLFDGVRPVALLDFEFAHVGVPQFDIAFFAMMDRVMAEAYAGAPRLTGFPDEDETFDLYEEMSGIAVTDRDYFCRMAVAYMALANTRVYQRLAAEKRMPVADVARNPPLRFLGEMFGVAAASF